MDRVNKIAKQAVLNVQLPISSNRVRVLALHIVPADRPWLIPGWGFHHRLFIGGWGGNSLLMETLTN